jgi:hydrogenase maturation protein HypF
VGHLRPAPLPGGELAVRSPWRALLGYASLEPELANVFGLALQDVPSGERVLADHQLARRLNAPLASSMGRLFDAAAAVLGVRQVARYEGEAAMMLESLAGTRAADTLPFTIVEREPAWMIDPIPTLVALAERRARGEDVRVLAAAFHETVASATAEMTGRLADAHGLSTVALGGGVFQNARLLTSLARGLGARGLRVLVPRLLSPNDGAVSFGQACVAAALLHRQAGG